MKALVVTILLLVLLAAFLPQVMVVIISLFALLVRYWVITVIAGVVYLIWSGK